MRSVTASEFAFLALGLVLGVAAAPRSSRSSGPGHPSTREVRVTVAPNSIPRRRAATAGRRRRLRADRRAGPRRSCRPTRVDRDLPPGRAVAPASAGRNRRRRRPGRRRRPRTSPTTAPAQIGTPVPSRDAVARAAGRGRLRGGDRADVGTSGRDRDRARAGPDDRRAPGDGCRDGRGGDPARLGDGRRLGVDRAVAPAAGAVAARRRRRRRRAEAPGEPAAAGRDVGGAATPGRCAATTRAPSHAASPTSAARSRPGPAKAPSAALETLRSPSAPTTTTSPGRGAGRDRRSAGRPSRQGGRPAGLPRGALRRAGRATTSKRRRATG